MVKDYPTNRKATIKKKRVLGVGGGGGVDVLNHENGEARLTVKETK